MSLVRAKNTKPEIAVRRLLYSMGYRYRLHRRDLPGCPDIVFASKHKIIFVHGCFWHGHEGCRNCRLPRSKLDFWKPKLEANRKRDMINERKLKDMGWKLMVVWECEVSPSRLEALRERLRDFLKDGGE